MSQFPSRFEIPESEIPFRAIVEQSIVGLYVIQDGLLCYVNQRYADLYGYTREEMLGQPTEKFIYPGDHPAYFENLRKRISGEVPSIRYVLRGVHKSGSIIDMEAHGSRFIFRGRPAIIGVQIDISDSKRKEAEIRESRERLRELSSYMTRLREDQRTQIAREIHDVLGGILTTMKMDLGWLNRNADPEGASDNGWKGRLQDLLALADDAIETVRKIASDLRPGVLDNLGLLPAIEWQAGEFRRRMGIECNVSLPPQGITLPDDVATAIFRIFQEALTNIVRHAEATRVDIVIAAAGQQLEITVEDNGRGITESYLRDPKSYGILGMHERARDIGAKLLIEAGAPLGTRVLLTYPLEQQP